MVVALVVVVAVVEGKQTRFPVRRRISPLPRSPCPRFFARAVRTLMGIRSRKLSLTFAPMRPTTERID